MTKWNKFCRLSLFINFLLLMMILGLRFLAVQELQKERLEINSSAAMAVSDDMKPKIAITFDDGPHPIYTKKLLEGLKERNVHATFFLVGKNIKDNEQLVRQMYEDGHLIGNHTYDHVQINTMTDESACGQITKTNDLIHMITGNDTAYIRPPFGLWRDDLECGIQMIPVMWNIDPLDWTTTNVSGVVNKVVKNARENAIILLHDNYGTSVKAALQIVDILQTEGYEFVTVDELILE